MTPVHPVTIVYQKGVTIWVAADSREEAIKLAKEAAPDVDVMDAPGSDYDRWAVESIGEPEPLAELVENDAEYVWTRRRDGRAYCGDAGEVAEMVNR